MSDNLQQISNPCSSGASNNGAGVGSSGLGENMSLSSISVSSILLTDALGLSHTSVNATSSNPKSNCWVKMSECDEFIGPKRSKHTMVAYGNSLYVFGGDNGKQMLNDLVTYDCNNNSWGRALNGSPPTPRYHHTAVVYNNSMFVFGGYTGDINSNSNLCNKNDLYEYRFANGSWLLWNTESAPVARAAHGAVVYDHKLWIFGGYDGNCRLNDMWSVPLNQGPKVVWSAQEQTGEQPSTVCNSPLVLVQDSMYLFSGQSGAKTSNNLFKFDFKTLYWTKISSNYILRGTNCPPERRSGHIMVAHGNYLYIYGGVLGNSFFHDIYSFDLDTHTWELISMHSKSPTPFGRSFLAASVQNENLYVFGGNGDQNVRSNELFRFKLPNQPKSTLRTDFYKLLKKEIFCDLKFICSNNETVMAHCAIVACRSLHFRHQIKLAIKEKLSTSNATSVGTRSSLNVVGNVVPLTSSTSAAATAAAVARFRSSSPASLMFVNNEMPPFFLNPDDQIEIKVTNETAEPFRLVLEFLYTDQIVSLEGRENQFETLKLIVNVYKLANQYMISRLKKICESFVDYSITCSNVLSLLRYVDLMNLHRLKELCMRFLYKDLNFNQVIMLTEFEQLQTSLIVECIRLRQAPKINSTDPIEELGNIEKCPTLESDMENFLKSENGNEFADVFIILNDGNSPQQPPLLAHMCILAARCAYFEAHFRSFLPKDRKVIMTIGDTIPPRQACISLLRYIYCDDVSMPPQDALYLFSASHYFQFSNLRLHVFCKQNLEANVSKNNVFDILEAADKIKDENMKSFALRIVRNNFQELVRSDRIRKLSKELLLDILIDISNIFPPVNYLIGKTTFQLSPSEGTYTFLPNRNASSQLGTDVFSLSGSNSPQAGLLQNPLVEESNVGSK